MSINLREGTSKLVCFHEMGLCSKLVCFHELGSCSKLVSFHEMGLCSELVCFKFNGMGLCTRMNVLLFTVVLKEWKTGCSNHCILFACSFTAYLVLNFI